MGLAAGGYTVQNGSDAKLWQTHSCLVSLTVMQIHYRRLLLPSSLIGACLFAGVCFSQQASSETALSTDSDQLADSDTPALANPALANPALANPALATDSVSPGDKPPLELPPEVVKAGRKAKDKFLEIRSRLADELGKMRSTNIRYLNDEDRSPEAEDRYRKHRDKSRELMNELFVSGLEVLRIVADAESARYLVTMIEHRMKHDYYDVATMEAGARMIDAQVQEVDFIYPMTARTAVICGDFVLARRLFEILNIDKIDKADQRLFRELDELEKQWKREQELIEASAGIEKPQVQLITTRGEVTLELFIDSAPSTVAHFITLVEQGYYDGLDFFQVIDHILALTGDELGNGEGNMGKFIKDEHTRENARVALAGSLVMAKLPAGPKGQFHADSASSQFAILYFPITHLTESQTVFGRVTKGMDVISELRRVDPSKKKEKNQILLPPDRILSMKVISRPEKLPEIQYVDHAGHQH